MNIIDINKDNCARAYSYLHMHSFTIVFANVTPPITVAGFVTFHFPATKEKKPFLLRLGKYKKG